MSNTKKDRSKTIKHNKPTTEGKCPYCNEHVKSLENHMHDKHRSEKHIKEMPKKK